MAVSKKTSSSLQEFPNTCRRALQFETTKIILMVQYDSIAKLWELSGVEKFTTW